MTTIYLMRHGQTQNPNQVFYGPEFELTEHGREQATKVALGMKTAGIKPAVVRCSPFKRTQQTCRIITDTLGLPIASIEPEVEEWRVGKWFNRSLAEFNEKTHYDQTPPRVDDPEIEPLEQMATRVVKVISEVLKKVSGSSALIVSHREPIVTAMLRLQGISLDNVHAVDCEPSAVWKLEFKEDGTFQKAEKIF